MDKITMLNQLNNNYGFYYFSKASKDYDKKLEIANELVKEHKVKLVDTENNNHYVVILK